MFYISSAVWECDQLCRDAACTLDFSGSSQFNIFSSSRRSDHLENLLKHTLIFMLFHQSTQPKLPLGSLPLSVSQMHFTWFGKESSWWFDCMKENQCFFPSDIYSRAKWKFKCWKLLPQTVTRSSHERMRAQTLQSYLVPQIGFTFVQASCILWASVCSTVRYEQQEQLF